MLIELSLSDFALADRLVFEPARGLVVVTGETGSGKSLLVNALGFAAGARAQAECVRSGAARCEVSAVFRVTNPEPFREWLDGSDPVVVLRRDLSAEGKSRGWINDRPVPLATLKRAGQLLCDLHGQNQHQGLLDPESHAAFLDGFLRGTTQADYERAFDGWTACRQALSAHREKFQASLEQKDFWEFQRNELDKVDPRPGEYEELEARRELLKSGEQRALFLNGLLLELSDAEAGIVPRLGRLVARLESDGPSEWEAHLRQALVCLEEALRTLDRSAWAPDAEEQSLEHIEQRLHALYGLKKKFGGSLEAAVAQREKLSENLRFLEDALHEGRRLEREEAAAASRLREAGSALAKARREAGTRMRKALAGPLAELGLGTDPVEVRELDLEFEQWTESGSTSVEFFLAANPGERPKPLAKIASGGELSRIMLGLKSVVPGAQLVETLVFDEIDAGIGGQTAARVAHQLKSLSSGRQVIVITHLHQIASQADSHCEVYKVMRDGRHVPDVRTVRASERKAALARLIASEETVGVERAARTMQRPGRSD